MMSKQEFIKRAKELGYSEEDIEECIAVHQEAKKDGVLLDLEAFLVERPVD